MIPSDVVSRLQNTADASLRPVARAQEISDKLSGLVAGQRISAQIQALLPNGTYRALIDQQRSITLALPFTAKTGDTLELLVTESDGKLAFALLSQEGKGAQTGVPTTLSRTAQFIGTLFAGKAQDGGKGTEALLLNGSRPISLNPPTQGGAELAPLLKQALSQSGMFYEAHQAKWVEGQLPRSTLLEEPQGRLSHPRAWQEPEPVVAGRSDGASQPELLEARMRASVLTHQAGETPQKPAGTMVAPEAQTVVQRQLEAFSTQHFVWQGQVWPGQEMRWEIEDEGRGEAQEEEGEPQRWRTRLHLSLPRLGEIDATLRLEKNELIIAMGAKDVRALDLIRASGALLRSRLEAAGLNLVSIAVDPIEEKPAHASDAE